MGVNHGNFLIPDGKSPQRRLFSARLLSWTGTLVMVATFVSKDVAGDQWKEARAGVNSAKANFLGRQSILLAQMPPSYEIDTIHQTKVTFHADLKLLETLLTNLQAGSRNLKDFESEMSKQEAGDTKDLRSRIDKFEARVEKLNARLSKDEDRTDDMRPPSPFDSIPGSIRDPYPFEVGKAIISDAVALTDLQTEMVDLENLSLKQSRELEEYSNTRVKRWRWTLYLVFAIGAILHFIPGYPGTEA